MALIAAWWGIWHIFSGMTLAIFWSAGNRQSDLFAKPFFHGK
ncbi:MAG: hypothetical protein R3C26_10290 [Calditrichia bacterium]